MGALVEFGLYGVFIWLFWAMTQQLKWYDVNYAKLKADMSVVAAKAMHDHECMALIDELRRSEGWMVEIVCDNPDFDNGPQCVVGVFGEWPLDTAAEGPWMWEWATRNFTGVGLLDCLRKARGAIAMREPYISAGVKP